MAPSNRKTISVLSFKIGISFCQDNGINIERASIQHGLEFLTFLYKQGLGYSAINTARSALSAVITLDSQRKFGEHPLVTRFLKGVFELKPSLPRYSGVWDVGTFNLNSVSF